MTRYIYIDEDNVPKQSDTAPLTGDEILIDEGLVAVYRVSGDGTKLLIEEYDKGEWKPMEESKIINEGKDDACHG